MQVGDQPIAIWRIPGETGRMLKPLTLPAALLAALAFAVPASAQAPSTDTTPAPVCSGTGEDGTPTCTSGDQADQGTQTIGDGQVVTDPADQVDGPTVPDDGDRPPDQPKQGEVHVLGDSATASSKPSAPAAASPVVSTSQSAVGSRQSAEPVNSAKTLPFTGIDAGPLVAIGLLLLGGGLLLQRRVRLQA
jgi:hypothetical protein